MTARVIFSMSLSLDGYSAGPGGDLSWSVPGPEQFGFHTKEVSELGLHLCGRRLYETMVYWDRIEENDPSLGEAEREFARLWKQLPKIVFSSTLEHVEGNARLATADPATELERAKERYQGDIAVGGPGLAASLTKLRLIDEYWLFVNPVVLGGGTPYFPSLAQPMRLELLETRTFSSRVVYLRYGVVRS